MQHNHVDVLHQQRTLLSNYLVSGKSELHFKCLKGALWWAKDFVRAHLLAIPESTATDLLGAHILCVPLCLEWPRGLGGKVKFPLPVQLKSSRIAVDFLLVRALREPTEMGGRPIRVKRIFKKRHLSVNPFNWFFYLKCTSIKLNETSNRIANTIECLFWPATWQGVSLRGSDNHDKAA